MSIFKSQGVILKSKKIADKNIIYTIFTSDYGKIICNKKFSVKEKSLDLGYLINFEIDVKQGINIHKIKNIKIVSEFNSIGKGFETINQFLELLNIINTKLPENLQNLEVFENLEATIKFASLYKKNIKLDSTKILLMQLKILNILGILDLQHTDHTIKKILGFIHKNKSREILKLKGINEKLKEKLQKRINNTL